MDATTLPTIRRLAVGAILALLAAACGGSSSAPTNQQPSPASTVSLAVVSVESLVVTMETTATGFLYKVSYLLRETAGRSSATLTGVSYALSTGGTTDPTLSGTTRIPAGQAYNPGTISVTDNTGRGPSPQLTVNVTFTDDSGQRGSASAVGSVRTIEFFSLVGFIRDRATNRNIGGARVSILDGADSGKTSTANTDGYYVFAALQSGTFNISATAPGYSATTFEVFLSRNNQVDLTIPSTAAPPSPGPIPTPSPNGPTCPASSVPPGTTALCNDGAFSQSQNRSGTCSSHNGVRCWICPGALCTP